MGFNGMQVSPATIKKNTIERIQELLPQLEVYDELPNTKEHRLNQDLQAKLNILSFENLKDILIKISKIQESCSGDITMGKSQDTSYEQYISEPNIGRENLEALVKGGLSSIKTTLEGLSFELGLDNQSLTSILTGLNEIVNIINIQNIEKGNNTQQQ